MSLRDQLKVMVVDDMATSRGLITDALDSFGIKNVRSANDATIALTEIGCHSVHLVISDLNMPGMDGRAAIPWRTAKWDQDGQGRLLADHRPGQQRDHRRGPPSGHEQFCSETV